MFNELSNYKVKKVFVFLWGHRHHKNSQYILGLNWNTINRYFNRFGEAIFADSLPAEVLSTGEFELDGSYFGVKRVRGKKGRTRRA